MSLVEKVLASIGHAEKCQALAVTASSERHRAEYLKLAEMWLDLAKTRRQWLIDFGLYTPP
jgi:hypothetical protein